MHWIETKGTWREIGRQYARQLPDTLREFFQNRAPWVEHNPAAEIERAKGVKDRVAAVAPELLEETQGMAQELGLDPEALLAARMFNELGPGCSVAYLADSNRGPLLGRNCDIEPESVACQVARTIRPTGETARFTLNYPGLFGGVGMNAHGLGLGGASAHTPAGSDAPGLPGTVLMHQVLSRARSLAEASDLLTGQVFQGKSAVVLVGDAHGESAVFEFVPGQPPGRVDRPAGQPWHVCTNFFPSPHTPIKPELAYLQNTYARYGRLVYRLNHQAPTAADFQEAMGDAVQNALCCGWGPGGHVTAYSHIAEPAAGRIRVWEGGVGTSEPREVLL